MNHQPNTPASLDEEALRTALKSKNSNAARGLQEAAAAYITYDGAAADLNALASYVHRLERTIEQVLAAPGAAIDAREQEDIEPQPHHPGRWVDKQNPGWSFPSKEAAFAARGQEAMNTARMEWLHTSNKDAEGYEYGVCKVKFDAAGRLRSFLWTASDSSDVDAAMTAARSVV